MTAHVRRRENLSNRHIVNIHHASLRKRIASWAVDTRTTIPQLRLALDDAIASQPRPEWDLFTLKIDYLDLMRVLEQPFNLPRDLLEEQSPYRLSDMQLPTEVALHLTELTRYLSREPDRSRRVIRLLFANWLAQVGSPNSRQTGPAVRARFHVGKRATAVLLYPVALEAPSVARVMSPAELANWLVSTNDAKLLLGGGQLPFSSLGMDLWPSVRQSERSGHRELLVLLAGELYRRERGSAAPSEQALVDRYLKSLPDDGSAEFNDRSAAIVSDSEFREQTPRK